jgi:hypothetical protein
VNPDFRKVALIAAVLGLLVSLFIALRPDDDDEAAAPTTVATTTGATTTAPATTETEPPATTAPERPDVVMIRITVPSDEAPQVRRYSVKRGREVVIVVRTELSDHVHLHGYDLMADVGPGRPATIRFAADAPGRFELELEDLGLEFAELEVRP